MAGDIRVTLIFDPFGICPESQGRVTDFASEMRAFREIEDLLRRDEKLETIQPRTYIIEARCWEHFRTYRGVNGLHIEEVSPRTRLRDCFSADPPEWLTDERILHLRLLDRQPPASFGSSWPRTVATWLLPGIAEAATVQEWLRIAASADALPEQLGPEPLDAWLRESFAHAAAKSGLSKDVVTSLSTAFEQSACLKEFARVLLLRRALLPLAEYGSKNLLRSAGVNVGSAQQRVLARLLPLVFPLPSPLHIEVSEQMRRAVQNARVKHPGCFEDAVLRLNALWDGVTEELAVWLDMEPRGMTVKSAAHMRQLPGFAENEFAQRLVEEYIPPDPVPAWSGLDDTFDAWIAEYARYMRRCFVRRDLPAADGDPAVPFSRWLKDHETVGFTHPERAYCAIAKRIQKLLAEGRAVVLILIDAMATHVLHDAIGYFSDHLGQEATWSSHVFAPIPTITDVCKEAVLTGELPDKCCGNLASALCRTYRLDPAEMQMASSWQDGERLRIGQATRLVVYRDNRLDDQLHSMGSYKVLLEECARIFPRLAQLAARWVADFRCLTQSSPVVLVTADHGFTYGPRLEVETPPGRKFDPAHRCMAISDDPANRESLDGSLTLVDKDRFHLPKSYLAASGRSVGTGTASGWVMSHGGLLPEEVVIPAMEWFGDEGAMVWPTVAFPEGALFDRDHWILCVLIRNAHTLPVPEGTVRAAIVDGAVSPSTKFPRLMPGDEVTLEVLVPGDSIPDGERLRVEVTTRARQPHSSTEREHAAEYLVPRARQFVETTADQVDFESMF